MELKVNTIILLSFLFLLFANTLSAQEFAPLGAKWYFPVHHCCSSSIGVMTYESIGDTTINDKICKVLYKDRGTVLGPSGNYYLHQSSDSIFLYDEINGEFDLMIDFGAMPGDTFLIEKSIGLYYPDTMYCVIDSITYISISDEDSLRVQNARLVATLELGNDTFSVEYDKRIIEKVGFEYGLLPLDLWWLADYYVEGDVRCYEDNETALVSFSDVDCLYTPTKELENEVAIEVYPNPTSDFLNIYFLHPEMQGEAKFDLLNTNGRSVLQFESRFGDITHMVDVGSLAAGVYFLRCLVGGETIVKEVVVAR